MMPIRRHQRKPENYGVSAWDGEPQLIFPPVLKSDHTMLVVQGLFVCGESCADRITQKAICRAWESHRSRSGSARCCAGKIQAINGRVCGPNS